MQSCLSSNDLIEKNKNNPKIYQGLQVARNSSQKEKSESLWGSLLKIHYKATIIKQCGMNRKEQNWNARNKHLCVWSADSLQKCQELTVVKGSLLSGSGKTGIP